MESIPPPELLARNLEALREVNHELSARLINAAHDAPPAVLTATRDGRMNFRINYADGHSAWFGQTSIPQVRAEALIEQFDAGTNNVLLPGIAEGTEAQLLLARLQPLQCVFVWESNPTNARLVLSLHDFAANLRRRRLVVLVCPLADLTSSLVAWLEAHPDQVCPARMLRWPWQTHAEIAEIRSAVEAAWNESQGKRAQQNAD